MANYRIISSDNHVFEPPDMWTSRAEPRFRDRVPRIVRDEDGFDWWYSGDQRIIGVSPGAQVGRRFEDPDNLTRKDIVENIRPGGYIPEEHIKDMDADGVDMGIIYPTVGLLLYNVPDTDLLTAIFSTYNDWLAEFCKPFPKQLKGIAMVNIDDVQEGIKELERCAKMGLVGAMIPVYPPEDRSYISLEYEPPWATAPGPGDTP